MKFIKILTILIFLSVSSFAINIKYFSSIGIGHSSWTVNGIVVDTNTKKSYTSKIKNKAWLQEIRLGIVLYKHHKTYFSYAHINSSSDNSIDLFGINYDYLFTYNKLIPFLGISYYFFKYKEILKNENGISWDKDEGVVNSRFLSLRLGSGYKFDRHNFINIQYDHSILKLGNGVVGFTYNSTHYNENIEIENLDKFSIIYNYSF